MKKARFSIYVFSCVIASVLILAGHALAAQNRGKGVAKSLIPSELKNMTIYDYFLESKEREVATIQSIEGTVIVVRPDLKQAYFAAARDRLYKKDVLYTLKKSRCKFKLTTEDTVSLGQLAKLNIKEVVDDRENQSKSSFFGMTRGMAIFATVRVSRYLNQSMQVETPTAVSGVRGSQFGVQIKPSSKKSTASQPIQLADASGGGFIYLAQAAKESSVTVVHGFEGRVEVQSKKDNKVLFLDPGQSIEATFEGLGKIFETPVKAVKEFKNTVDASFDKAAEVIDKQSKAVEKKLEKPVGEAVGSAEKKMEKPIGAIEKFGKDLENFFSKEKK